MKDFFAKLGGAALVIAVGVLLSMLGTMIGHSGSAEADEAKADNAAYKAEVWQEGYDAGYSDAKRDLEHELAQIEWEYSGALENAQHDIDMAYEAGYEACLEDYGLNEHSDSNTNGGYQITKKKE